MPCAAPFLLKAIALAAATSFIISCGVKGPPEPPIPTEASAAKVLPAPTIAEPITKEPEAVTKKQEKKKKVKK